MVALATSTNPQLPTYFNINGDVGKGCTNSPADVELVSFLFSRVANDPGRPADQRAVFSQVRPGASCTPELIAAIDKLEDVLGYRRDGKVSVAKTASGAFGAGQGYLICQLNFQTKKYAGDAWPRLDKVPGCPPSLAAHVKKLLIGSA